VSQKSDSHAVSRPLMHVACVLCIIVEIRSKACAACEARDS